jgi:hypothetical protein
MDNVRPVAAPRSSRAVGVSQDGTLGLLRLLTRLMDEAVQVPGTRLRLGLDSLLGLLPGFGDLAGALASGYSLLVGVRAGVPGSVLVHMFLNIVIDAVVGMVPLLGDLFDVGWKANRRNLDLLEQHLERPAATRRSSSLVVAGVFMALLCLVIGLFWLLATLVRSVGSLLGL